MTPARTFFIAALCSTAVSALPFDLGSSGFGTNGAYAKSENGGGNGGGNGGNGGGNGGNGGSASERGGSQGKSASAAGQNKASVGKIDRKAAKIAAKQQHSVAKQQQVAAVEKNLNGKLGRLNSLKRNINAYINSKSPKFAGCDEAEDPAALEAALIEMSNKTIDVDEDGFVDDDDVVSWTEGVLGVGSAVGKIDEMREVLEAAAEEAAAETAETVDPVIPVEPAP